MLKIEVFGPGCPKCKQTAANVEQAVKSLGVEAEIVKVEDPRKIAERGVMITPAVAINGQIMSTGKVPTPKEIEEWIRRAI